MSFATGRLFLSMGLLSCTVLSAAVASPASAANKDFMTPSGNILCTSIEATDGYGNSIACEIRNRKSKSPLQPRPADCESDKDWGSGFIVYEAGRAELNCFHGGTLPPPNTITLQYGKTIQYHGISCKAEKTGLTCRNAKGHGFTISRAKQRLF